MAAVRLILASRSPRRVQLLRDAGYDVEQAEPLFVDPAAPSAQGVGPRELAARLARQKALSLRSQFASRDVVILAADTICVGSGGGLVGTPESAEEAERMIRGFAGGAHEVVTGVAMLRPLDPQPDAFADGTIVLLGPLSDEEIRRYVQGGQWRGKAGGYNLTERQMAGWPLSVQGDPTTVVGLPMAMLEPRLAELGVEKRS